MQGSLSKRVMTNMVAYLMIFPAMFFFILYLVYPLFKSFHMSLYNYSGVGPLTKFVGMDNYAQVFKDDHFYQAMQNNFVLMASEIIVSMTVAFLLAYLLYKGVYGWKIFNVILFLPYIIPLTVSAVIWSLIYEPTIGLLNQALGAVGLQSLQRIWLGKPDTALFSIIIVWIWRTIPFNMLILLGTMLKIPKDLIEAARIDGAHGWRIVWHLILPLVMPTILLLCVISIANDFRAFDIVWVMTQGGPADATEIASTLVYKVGFQQNKYGYANAIAFVVFIVVTVFVAIISLLRSQLMKQKGD
ncbi:hypothetical protein A8709_20975 [Paenibacillus pectinilyticus]|uniref:ABC transmembrane type-1 domain-containing protein n=1 Tax=Paenibacillus pectinilyticus TaxID=512399 RepID=A0A1C0ZXF3_9BACL|nr:sugar ABC transporter permease [Paenibacillus pectinilyticus]OCT12815.1 hypothetical protein A8709_20975 [Paenibacillus pectinilyticus]